MIYFESTVCLKQSFEQLSLDELHGSELLEIAKESLHQFGLTEIVDLQTQKALIKIYVTRALQEFFTLSELKEAFWKLQDEREMWESDEQTFMTRTLRNLRFVKRREIIIDERNR